LYSILRLKSKQYYSFIWCNWIYVFSEEWLAVAKQYDTVWNFPHSLGAADKNIKESASEYFNYKNIVSIVLFT